jgi:hypothetical protein
MTNVCDRVYIGPAATVSTYTPLLNPVALNPNTVLLLLFQNAVPEMNRSVYRVSAERSDLVQCMLEHQYLPYPLSQGEYEQLWHTDVIQYEEALGMLGDMDTPSERFANEVGLKYMLIQVGLRPRYANEHTVVSAWPDRIIPRGTKTEFVAKLSKCLKEYAM